ncbi:Hypothetical_protein [Hexamita inflata]|uniref:Hypothetical_protein n=1 Tax=Hexamita inflata TaxID=28002 RepID=A0AA86Q845_9EUKA|nr:Hypothetical protein HINF_LOCUS41616 [Hexamita inflata]
MEFLELSTSKRSFVNYYKPLELTLQTNYESQCFQMFRKTIQADNNYQNSDVCKFLQISRTMKLGLCNDLQKDSCNDSSLENWRSLKPMNSQNPKIHFLLFYKSKLRRTSLHKSIILTVSKNQRC